MVFPWFIFHGLFSMVYGPLGSISHGLWTPGFHFPFIFSPPSSDCPWFSHFHPLATPALPFSMVYGPLLYLFPWFLFSMVFPPFSNPCFTFSMAYGRNHGFPMVSPMVYLPWFTFHGFSIVKEQSLVAELNPELHARGRRIRSRGTRTLELSLTGRPL